MSSTTLTIIDSNLLSGSIDDFRDKFGGFYSDSENTQIFLEPRLESYSTPIIEVGIPLPADGAGTRLAFKIAL